MKQKGKTWYTCKGEATLAKYVPPLLQASERIGQKIATTAEEIEKRLSQAKYDFHKLCMEAYNEYLKTGQPVKRFSFLTFDKMVKVEFDVQEGYIRAYRATKKDPSYKDYELINTDFSSSIMRGLPKNEEEAAARQAEREFIPGIADGKEDFIKKHPLIPSEAFEMTLEEVKQRCLLVAAQEDDPDNFEEYKKKVPDGPWVFVMEPKGPDSNDITIRRNGDFYMVNDCGMLSLWKEKVTFKKKGREAPEQIIKGEVSSHEVTFPLSDELAQEIKGDESEER